MKVGTPVEVRERRCSFFGQRGHVTQIDPHIMVLLEGEKHSMRFGRDELVVLETPQHIAGAE